jgi:hypothetical protein
VKIPNLACCGLVLLLAAPGVAAERPEPWRILILNDGSPFLPGSAMQEEGLRTAVEAAALRPVEFHVEFLDSVSFEPARYEAEFVSLLRKKHEGIRIDLVMPLGPVSLDFAERHRAEMWPDASVVFLSVSQETLRASPPGPHTTGVLLGFDETGTLDLARRLQPSARRLVLISGASAYDRGWEPLLREAVRRRGEGLEVSYVFGEPLPDVLRKVAALPRTRSSSTRPSAATAPASPTCRETWPRSSAASRRRRSMP